MLNFMAATDPTFSGIIIYPSYVVPILVHVRHLIRVISFHALSQINKNNSQCKYIYLINFVANKHLDAILIC